MLVKLVDTRQHFATVELTEFRLQAQSSLVVRIIFNVTKRRYTYINLVIFFVWIRHILRT